MGIITCRDVSVEVDGRCILQPFSLDLTEQRVVVLGANGSGKSTFLKLLNGLVGPTYGHVTVEGFDTIDAWRDVRARVAFTFPDPESQLLLPTVGEDIDLSRRTAQRRGARKKGATAQQFLDNIGLNVPLNQAVATLSGGQKQIVALLSVLAAEPDILVCDEPTTRLDLRWRNRIIDVLASLPQRIIYATHDLEHATTADRALVIHDGAVIFDGAPHAAVRAYRRLMADL
ncbi:energy-coupling factor ABC transporter ATP-binding protein [Jonesia quinghaiensis]|uniref:energy-coupling factor ABC transporter ATP-binding protein n=1 Tax=Jonesia quinghaiensis TaxID=262806 RepID=UPI00040AEE33|nr:energy-coupling factor ABC transporter ATP-binding protein [Jonesia quinghaiensis]